MHPHLDKDAIRTARCTIGESQSFLKRLRAIAATYHTHIICFNADLIAGRIHAAAAVSRAVRAIGEGTAISNTVEMESLLYAAGSRQCNVAASFGIHEGENRVFVCCYPVHSPAIWAALEPLFCVVEENWDSIGPEKLAGLMKSYGITPEEILAAGGEGRIVDLVLERVALLQVLR
jgi:KEOPS complex subunit Cgi121